VDVVAGGVAWVVRVGVDVAACWLELHAAHTAANAAMASLLTVEPPRLTALSLLRRDAVREAPVTGRHRSAR
jgi:hypothetical protein